MAERFARLWPWFALAWLFAVAGLAWQQAGFWREGRLDSDVFALLPDGGDARLAEATRRLADATTSQVTVLLDAGDWASTRRAADAFDQRLREAADGRLQPIAPEAGAAMDALAPYRQGLLTREQETRLAQADADQTADLALARLLGPGGGAGLSWADDPLGLWPEWLQAQAGRIGPRDGAWVLREQGRDVVLLRYALAGPAFRLDGGRELQIALDAAADAARVAAGHDITWTRGGVPLHAEAAAARASEEINTIGLGSLAAVLLLAWLAFRALRPILLVALSLAVGVLCGLAATSAVFGSVHLLSLVFGASLVGVAEDYGIHYFASRQASPATTPRTLLRQLAPALGLALVTSVLAYLALGLAPMPGLRQMALFSAAGLAGAFLSVLLWFPWLDRGGVRASAFARAVGASLARWPRWPSGRRGVLAWALLALVMGAGLWRLQAQDDLRSLQASPPDLVAQERELGRRLGLPSPAQYFLVTAADPETLLQREEALVDRLHAAAGQGGPGWRATSDLLPSVERQSQRRARVEALASAARARAAQWLGEAPAASVAPPPLRPAAWFALPASTPLRPLWLGEHDGEWASLVLLEGLSQDGLPRVAGLADGLAGVRWVDRTADYSRLLGDYRVRMGWLLLAGYAAVALALAARFGRRGWRALLPTAIAGLGGLATLGWLGEPFQLFTVLAQLLLLGIGVDYGIFLLEHEDDPSAWLAICLGAASTWLAFGLLALSSTPALRGFGLALGSGLAIVWLVTPCFRPVRAGRPTDPSGTPA